MSLISQKQKISTTVKAVKNASFLEKTKKYKPVVDSVLDLILEVKSQLRERTQEFEDFAEKLEQLTWYDGEVDEEILRQISDLIASANDLRISARKKLAIIDINLASEEIQAYDDALDDLKEACQDLESVFFNLPNTRGFEETTKELTVLLK